MLTRFDIEVMKMVRNGEKWFGVRESFDQDVRKRIRRRVVRENQLYHVVWRWEVGEGELLGGEMVVRGWVLRRLC